VPRPSYRPTTGPGENEDGDEDEDHHCTLGWHSVKCLDDGTVMRGEGCTSCGDCAMYDYTAATGGRATCELHGPDGSYSYSYSHSYSYSYAQGVTATYYFDGAEFPVPGECWYDDCDDDSDECAVHGLGPEYAKARPDGTPCDPGCECCRADGGCGECAGDHVCEFAGDYGYCTSCEAKFPGDDGLIEYCRNEAGDGFDWDGTHYDNTCLFGHDDGGPCRCCELITYVGDPNCEDGSDFFNALAAAGGETYSYIRTPAEGGWTEDYCGSGTLTEGCTVCGSCSLPAFSWEECDAIQPHLTYGGDRINYDQD